MKRLTSLLLIAAALVLTPTGAFAKDKHKHSAKYYNGNRQCGSQVYYGRSYVAPQYYYNAPSYCAPRYVAPSYYAPRYYAPSYYRGSSSGHCSSQRSSGLSFFFGF